MKKHKLEDMIGGWFIGNFTPSIIQNEDFEVAIKYYKENDYEQEHYHKIATEITVILDGDVIMSGKKYTSGDIIVIQPYESTDFKALTDVKTVVVKTPSAKDDKFLKNKI